MGLHSENLIVNLHWVSNVHFLASRLKAETKAEKWQAWPFSEFAVQFQ